MGLGLKLAVIMICIAFLFTFAPRQCGALETEPCMGYGHGFGLVQTQFGSSGTSGAFYNNIYLILFVGGGALIAASVLFPNPYILFAGLGMFLLAFATLPYSIITESQSFGLPANDPLVLFIGLIFGFLMVIAAITWYKGNEW